MSLDPLAVEFPAWSAYNYVLGNPVMLVDPSGLAPEGWSEDNVDLANRFGVFGNGETDYFKNEDNNGSDCCGEGALQRATRDILPIEYYLPGLRDISQSYSIRLGIGVAGGVEAGAGSFSTSMKAEFVKMQIILGGNGVTLDGKVLNGKSGMSLYGFGYDANGYLFGLNATVGLDADFTYLGGKMGPGGDMRVGRKDYFSTTSSIVDQSASVRFEGSGGAVSAGGEFYYNKFYSGIKKLWAGLKAHIQDHRRKINFGKGVISR